MTAALAVLLSLAPSCIRAAERAESALTGYVGRITTVNACHDIVTEPSELEFADAYLAALALSYTLARYREDALSVESEGQVVYNFGDSVSPMPPRFPRSKSRSKARASSY